MHRVPAAKGQLALTVEASVASVAMATALGLWGQVVFFFFFPLRGRSSEQKRVLECSLPAPLQLDHRGLPRFLSLSLSPSAPPLFPSLLSPLLYGGAAEERGGLVLIRTLISMGAHW